MDCPASGSSRPSPACGPAARGRARCAAWVVVAAALLGASAAPGSRCDADGGPWATSPHVFPSGLPIWNQGAGGWRGFDAALVPLRTVGSMSDGWWNADSGSCGQTWVRGSVTLTFDARDSIDLGPASTTPAVAFVDARSLGPGRVDVSACELTTDPDTGAVTVTESVPLASLGLYALQRVGLSVDLTPSEVFTEARPYLVFRFEDVNLGALDDFGCGLAIGYAAAPRTASPCDDEVVLTGPDDLTVAVRGGSRPTFTWHAQYAGPGTFPRATVEWSTSPTFRRAGGKIRRVATFTTLNDGSLTAPAAAWGRVVSAARRRGTVYWRVRVSYRWWVPRWTGWDCLPLFGCFWSDIPGHWDSKTLVSPSRRLVRAPASR